MPASRRTRIVIVDDSAVMRSLLRSVVCSDPGLEVAGTAVDGESALKTIESVHPDLILLDLNLPKKNGQEVLAEFKADPNLKRIPVVIITSSSGEEDVQAAYDNHANCYVTKPVDLKQFVRVVKSIEDFWLTIVTFPRS